MSSQQIPIVPLNFSAMKALLEENRRLREQLDQEKTELSKDIESIKIHISVAEQLAKTNRISPETYKKFAELRSSLQDPGFQPNLTFCKFSPGSQINDLSSQLKEISELYEEKQKESIMLSQKRTDLAIKEQKLNSKKSNSLRELTALRQQLQDLIDTKESIDSENNDLESLIEFWEERNKNAEKVLQKAFSDLKSFRQGNDSLPSHILEELNDIKQTLQEFQNTQRSKSGYS